MPEPTAHTEQPAGHGAFPPFQSEHYPSQLVWLTISFALLYVLMAKVALPRIGSILAERSRVIGDDLAAAERLKERSNAAHAAYEKALADARARAQGLAERDAGAAGARGRGAAQAAGSAIARAARRGGAIDRADPHRRHGQCARDRGGHRLGHRRAADRQRRPPNKTSPPRSGDAWARAEAPMPQA